MSEKSDQTAAIATGITITAAALATGFAVVAVNLGLGFAIPVGIVAVISAGVVFRGPLGRALARRLEAGADSQGDQEAVLQALDEVRGRMAELEERVDFAERLLSQAREPDRLRE